MVVYLIRMRDTDYFKVGISTDVAARLDALRTATPFALDLIESHEQSRAMEVERAIHLALNRCRVQGEWFNCPLEEILPVYRAHNAMAQIDDAMNAIEPPLRNTLGVNGATSDITPLLSVLRRARLKRDEARALLSVYGMSFKNDAWTEARAETTGTLWDETDETDNHPSGT